MSVQAGNLRFDGGPARSDVLAQLSYASAAFGPDGENTWVQDSMAMLYRPYNTTAKADSERQPLLVAGGNVFTLDGRLDNRDVWVSELTHPMDQDVPDVVLVAAAFEKWGPDCFGRFVGEWAACVWRPCENELFLARDYIGVRQLFYAVTSHSITWCSLLAPLVEIGNRFTLSNDYIAGYLARKPEADLTPFREIQSVPPGGFVGIRNARPTTHMFWSFNPSHRVVHKTDAEYEEQYRFLFRQAVKRRLRSHRPVLASLSGGLDSSSIVCMADDIVSADSTLNTSVDTVSYYDSEEPDEDDLFHLELVEARRGRKGFRLELRGTGDSLMFHYPSLVPSPGFGLRSEVQEGLASLLSTCEHRVFLSGTGGDEMNGQALNPFVAIADLVAHLRLCKAGQLWTDWSLLTRTPYLYWMRNTLLELMPFAWRVRATRQKISLPWINREFAERNEVAARQLERVDGVWFWRPGPRDALQTITTLSRELTRSLPTRLEQRYPYLDQDLVTFLTSIPCEQLLQPGKRRYLMRRALEGLLPSEVLQRKTKVSAARCYAITIEKHWREIEDALSTSMAAAMGFVNRDVLRSHVCLVKNGQGMEKLGGILRALSLEFWLRDISSRKTISVQNSFRTLRKDPRPFLWICPYLNSERR